MTEAHGVARDQLRAFIERIERLEEEKKTIADDIKEVYGEAKGLGFDTVIMKRVIALRKKDDQKRMEEEMILATYLHALGMAQGDLFEEPEPKTEYVPYDRSTGEILDDEPVNAKLIETVVKGVQTEIGRAALIAAVDIMIEREEAEETHVRSSTNDEASPEAGPQAEASPAGTGAGTLADREGRFNGEAVSADLPTNSVPSFLTTSGAFAQPSEDENSKSVWHEITPPMPMRVSKFAHCFPELSKEAYARLSADIDENGIQTPIIRMGDVILDGWNRYNIARSLRINYPVRRYRGDDALLDVIAMQRESRDWGPARERKIAAALVKEFPDRAADIMAAFQIEAEEAA